MENLSENWKVSGLLTVQANKIINEKYDYYLFFGHLSVNREYGGQGIFMKMVLALGEWVKATDKNIKGLVTWVNVICIIEEDYEHNCDRR